MSQGPKQDTVSGEKAVVLVVVIFATLLAVLGYLAAWGGSQAAGLVVDVGLLIYVLAILTYARLRYVPLGLMLGADAGHLTYDAVLLHAKVTLYPLVEALTSLSGHVSYVFDPVQALVIAEVIYAVYTLVDKGRAVGRALTSQGQVSP